MADRLKDAEDRRLESLFASDPIPDAGFSIRIEKRIRRQQWIRRLALPIAVLVGGLIAAKPLIELLTALVRIADVLPGSITRNFGTLPLGDMPQMSTVMMGAMLAIAAIMLSRLLED